MVIKSKGEKTREHILKKTRALLVSQGYHGTSINSIIQATGVKKGNLYYYFAGKEELGLAVLEDAGREFLRFLKNSFEGEDPKKDILNSAKAILQELQERNFTGGCLFGNTALEMSDTNQKFARVIRTVFDDWTAEYEQKLAEAGTLGRLPGNMPPPLMARTLVALIEGWIMLARIRKSENDVRDCLYALKNMLAE
ncbi:MAG: TetR/AcrR family transcriptional regulator [Desulfurivibrionaceae bacterium]